MQTDTHLTLCTQSLDLVGLGFIGGFFFCSWKQRVCGRPSRGDELHHTTVSHDGKCETVNTFLNKNLNADVVVKNLLSS